MKHLIARTLTSLMLAVVPVAVQAQSPQVIKASIPFEFNFGGKTLPAGDYSLHQTQQRVLVLRDSRGYAIAQTLTGGIDSLIAPEAAKLTFENSAGQHILTEVWQQADSSGLELYPVKSQSNFAKRHSTEARQAAEGSRP